MSSTHRRYPKGYLIDFAVTSFDESGHITVDELAKAMLDNLDRMWLRRYGKRRYERHREQCGNEGTHVPFAHEWRGAMFKARDTLNRHTKCQGPFWTKNGNKQFFLTEEGLERRRKLLSEAQ